VRGTRPKGERFTDRGRAGVARPLPSASRLIFIEWPPLSAIADITPARFTVRTIKLASDPRLMSTCLVRPRTPPDLALARAAHAYLETRDWRYGIRATKELPQTRQVSRAGWGGGGRERGKGERANEKGHRAYRGAHFSAGALNLKFGIRSRHCTARVRSDKLLAAPRKKSIATVKARGAAIREASPGEGGASQLAATSEGSSFLFADK